ncbi:MAG: asparagine synthase (glutamine-hydrolyzing) [Parvibaculaceae bacterium]|nr:asparagine synthase (glutamine-hydrolyzing) [Parvibaculaceae bacterium]HBM89905.1 asparagine synthase (glutamine-hydrolyzing) [Rhodobiaceae bacterium]|tara:strand:- start:1291 stop:3207 length:1917 start_codon:yes stop_codon:yes gene_type:complete
MCGIAGIVSLRGETIPRLSDALTVMGQLLEHRGPDDDGQWVAPDSSVGFAHRRLSILDLSPAGHQPMIGENGTVIAHNGEVYNYLELRDRLKDRWVFKSTSDTETVLAAYDIHGADFAQQLRGMFATAIYDQRTNKLTLVRDRFGIKPIYYTIDKDILFFASEAKALLPFLPDIKTDTESFAEYLTFQYCIGEQTLFKGIKQLMPGHMLVAETGSPIQVKKYWDVEYNIDYDHSPKYFEDRFQELLMDSMKLHLRSDVPVGSYMSGGIDSSLMAILAAEHDHQNRDCFHGKFTQFPGYDESKYALDAAEVSGSILHQADITAQDFENSIEDVIYHLDFPTAGPGSFPQYMVSKLAAEKVKVVLGGQGGDEIFGGYARYLVAYFEQCIKAALDGSYHDGHYVVTIESIIPNLGLLREYKPMIKMFWQEGLFEDLDARYFRLIDRSNDMTDEIDWNQLNKGQVFDSFRQIFNKSNVGKEAYFDKMTHFDFKCLLPALLNVEDRMAMAHGLESRVPFLDHPLVEFAATVPADVKFEGGNMKHLIKQSFGNKLPPSITNRRDKMGFPVPLKEWFGGELKDFVTDTFGQKNAQHRPFMNTDRIAEGLGAELKFSRKTWGLLSLEIWHQKFHDRAAHWKKMNPL